MPQTPNSRAWLHFFAVNHWPPLPPASPLTPHQRDLLASSLPQFQLGEGARGRSFRRRAAAFAEQQGDPHFLAAISAFIAEEHRHSAQLGQFLDLSDIPRLPADAADSAFRWLRKQAGLRLMVAVLVSAETVAVPYYRAVRNVTNCPRLRAICTHILRDESAHLRFQGHTLRRLGHHAGWLWLHRVAVLLATLTVFWQHRRLVRAAGYRLGPWLAETFHGLRIVECAAVPQRQRGALTRMVESIG